MTQTTRSRPRVTLRRAALAVVLSFGVLAGCLIAMSGMATAGASGSAMDAMPAGSMSESAVSMDPVSMDTMPASAMAVMPAAAPVVWPMADLFGMAQSATPPLGTDGASCPGCGSEPGSDHAMTAMACLIALLSAAIVLLAPAVLARLSTGGALAQPVRDAARLLPPPRPPSLLALSISRT